MKSGFRTVLVFVFLSGLFLTGLMGTSTSMTFVWPGYLLIGLAGLLSIGALFQNVSFSLPKWTTLSVFLLAFYLLSRAADSPVAYFAREDAMMVVACLIAYAGFISLCTSAKWRRGVTLTFAGLVLANLCFAALQMAVDPAIWLIPGYGRTMTDALGGLFNQPDHFAIFLAALVPLWLSLALFGREKPVFRFFWSGLATISFLFLAITGSVAGWIALAAGIMCFAFLTTFLTWARLKPSVKKFAVISLTALVLIPVGVGVFAAPSMLSQLGHGLFSKGQRSGISELWKVGVKQALESPAIGTGSRSSQLYGRLFRSESLGLGATEPEFVHNEFIQVMGDYGLVGLALFVFLLVTHGISGGRFLLAYRRVKPLRGELVPKSNHLALVAGFIPVLAALLMASSFDFIMHLPVMALLAAVLLATLAVPDPMAQALKEDEESQLIPGGSLLFAVRAVGFGGGMALVALGSVFVQSEYHYEMARKAFESGEKDFRQFRHLQNARSLDPKNPFALTLSAHAQVGSINSDMPMEERKQTLEKADLYFSRAAQLYPQDVFAAIGHVAVLDELGKKQRARERLRTSRQWAPLYGNLMLAEAEHYLRHGQISLAQETYAESLEAAAFRDPEAAREGLKTISEWKLIAQQNGIQWESLDRDRPDDGIRRVLPDAQIEERSMAGQLEVAP
ncbi:MAG: O-antigen ligase family protein [Verrucomicrobiales bacterium]|nr:O-antigen ligase family protein [Verrucomicrobiales bacterium]